MATSLRFPSPVMQGDRVMFWRSHLEAYKLALAGLAHESNPLPDVLIRASTLCRELGICRRTLGRRLREEAAARAVS